MNRCTTIEIFVPPMRCASGMCGPTMDEELVRFNETLGRLEQRARNAIAVHRYVPNQEPHKFMQTPVVMNAIKTGGWCAASPGIGESGEETIAQRNRMSLSYGRLAIK